MAQNPPNVGFGSELCKTNQIRIHIPFKPDPAPKLCCEPCVKKAYLYLLRRETGGAVGGGVGGGSRPPPSSAHQPPVTVLRRTVIGRLKY